MKTEKFRVIPKSTAAVTQSAVDYALQGYCQEGHQVGPGVFYHTPSVSLLDVDLAHPFLRADDLDLMAQLVG